jgi:hypothetical protein
VLRDLFRRVLIRARFFYPAGYESRSRSRKSRDSSQGYLALGIGGRGGGEGPRSGEWSKPTYKTVIVWIVSSYIMAICVMLAKNIFLLACTTRPTWIQWYLLESSYRPLHSTPSLFLSLSLSPPPHPLSNYSYIKKQREERREKNGSSKHVSDS